MGATTQGSPSVPYAPTTIAAVVLDVFQPNMWSAALVRDAGVFTARRNSVTSSAAGRGLIGGPPAEHVACLVAAFAMAISGIIVGPYLTGGSFVLEDNSLSHINAMPANSTAFAVGLWPLSPGPFRWTVSRGALFSLSRNVGMNVSASCVYAVYCEMDWLDAGGPMLIEHNRLERPSYGDTAAAVRLRVVVSLSTQGGIVSLSQNAVTCVEAARESSGGASSLHSAVVQLFTSDLYVDASLRIANNSLTDATVGTSLAALSGPIAHQWAVVDIAVAQTAIHALLTVANNSAHRIIVGEKGSFFLILIRAARALLGTATVVVVVVGNAVTSFDSTSSEWGAGDAVPALIVIELTGSEQLFVGDGATLAVDRNVISAAVSGGPVDCFRLAFGSLVTVFENSIISLSNNTADVRAVSGHARAPRRGALLCSAPHHSPQIASF